jgi:Transposase DDE domain group 1
LGFHPLHAYADQTREALAATLRPGNAAANTAADHMSVLDLALEQLPAERIAQIEILVRAPTALARRMSWRTTVAMAGCDSRSVTS